MTSRNKKSALSALFLLICDKEVVEVLLNAGADVQEWVYKAFRYAASCGHFEVAKILLKAGEDF